MLSETHPGARPVKGVGPIGGIAGSNPSAGKSVTLLSFVCCVDSGLCDELIPHSEEFYCVFVCVCLIVGDLETSKMRWSKPSSPVAPQKIVPN